MKYFSIVLFFILTGTVFGQKKFVASGDIFGRRVFIENKGQFDGVVPQMSIDFGYVNGQEQVYFNKKGLTYFLQKNYPFTEREREKLEHGEKVIPKPTKKCFINVTWENSNPNVEIVESEKQSFYHSFGDEQYKSDCFKKITYKNIYNNIDIEYCFTDDKQNGIKYNVILHPGANINDVKIKYSGDLDHLSLKKGNVIAKTSILDITELAPVSFQNGVKVESNFKVENNIISFNLPNGYDPSKELIIDPWVVNLALTSNNYAYDVDYDYAGNYYVYGGSGPFLTAKYSPAGTLQWTFGGVVPSVSWTSLGNYPSNAYIGNFLVDKISGKSYSGEGFNNAVGTRMVRVNQSGIYDNFISTASVNWNELWDMGFYCSNGTVFGLGGSIADNTSAGILNTTTGAIAPQNFTGLSSLAQDIVSHAIDPAGTVFLLFASSSTSILNNGLMKVNPAFNGNVWIAPSNYTSFQESANQSYPGSGNSNYSSNGYNALAVNASYLYYYDGVNVAAYNKTTGARIAFTSVPGQNIKEQGGIAVDDCNNVYVGGHNNIYCFNFNGTSFTANGTIPVASTSANKYVIDIKYSPGSNDLYVSGSGFGGIYTAINSLTCSVIQMSVATSCVGTSIGAAVSSLTTNIVSPIVSYSITNSSGVVVNSTGNTSSLTNTVSNLPNGLYTAITQINAPCGPVNTQTFIINCTCAGPSTPTAISGLNSICPNSTNTYSIATVAGATSYNWTLPSGWTGSSTSNTISATAGATGGTISVTASNTCGVSPPVTFTVSIGNPSITATGGAICIGNSYTINPSGAVSYTYSGGSAVVSPTTTTTYTVSGTNTVGCISTSTTAVTVTVNPTPTITINSGSVCIGKSFTITPSGASTYTYSSGSAIVSPVVNTTYTVSGTSTQGCIGSSTNTVTVNASPTITVNNGLICSGSTFTIIPSGAVSYTYSGGSAIVAPTSNTGYTVTGANALGCTNIAISTVSVVPSPLIAALAVPASVCLGESSTISVTGASNYTWMPGGSNSTSIIVTPTVSSTYTVSGNNSSGGLICSTSQTVLVSTTPVSTITAGGADSLCLGTSTIIHATGGNSYTWTPTTGVSNPTSYSTVIKPLVTTIYTVTGAANGLCPSTATIEIVVNPLPVVNAGRDTIINIDETYTLTGTGDVEVGFLSPDPNNPLSCNFCSTVVINPQLSTCYILRGENSHTCVNYDTVCVTVTKDWDVFIPNAFTPNNDTKNELFVPVGYGIAKIKLLIYDRWGEKIFESHDDVIGWDGKNKGKLCEQGVYVYKAYITSMAGNNVERTGHVTLLPLIK